MRRKNVTRWMSADAVEIWVEEEKGQKQTGEPVIGGFAADKMHS